MAIKLLLAKPATNWLCSELTTATKKNKKTLQKGAAANKITHAMAK